MQKSQTVIGVDLGGTHISAARICGEGNIQQHAHVDISERSTDAVFEALFYVLDSVADASTIAVGLGIPGNVDIASGDARQLPNFGWNANIPISKIVYERTGLQTFALNDARCAGLAEARLGAGQGADVFVMLTLGTGIGGGVFINGNLLRGASSDAGEIGHHTIYGDDGFVCGCGKRGCFEAHASAFGLVRHYEANGGRPATSKGVIAALHKGDANAATALEHFRVDLARGLSNIVAFYNPHVIALGGGLSMADEIFDGLQERVDGLTLPASRGVAKVIRAKLGVDAGLIGAALMAKDRLRHTSCGRMQPAENLILPTDQHAGVGTW